MMMKTLLSCVISFSLLRNTTAREIFGCAVEDLTGTWEFYESPRILNYAPTMTCSVSLPGIYRKVNMTFSPGKVVEENWTVGTATITDWIGVELKVNNRYYYAPFKNVEYTDGSMKDCGETHIGYSHDYNRRHWSCIYGKKISNLAQKELRNAHTEKSKLKMPNLDEIVGREYFEKMVHKINKSRKPSWEATVYDKFAGLTWRELVRYAGGEDSMPKMHDIFSKSSRRKFANFTDESKEFFDWRDVNGTNFVSPVRDQGMCGGCFAFATTAMAEARIRIQTNNRLQPIFSPQDIINCHQHSAGCKGGRPYLVAGDYGWHTGYAEEKCVPYVGIDLPCTEVPCERYYVTNGFNYVGGYFGGGEESKIMEAVKKNGPVSTIMIVYEDFYTYKRGVYYHREGGFSGLHSVLIVGYGYDTEVSMKYWTAKNSWSDTWGENGYFRIRRGTNECGCENSPIETFPIPH